MGEGDRFLFYKITFRHQITDQIEQNFYPGIGIVHDKQGNQLFSADFKDYLVIDSNAHSPDKYNRYEDHTISNH